MQHALLNLFAWAAFPLIQFAPSQKNLIKHHVMSECLETHYFSANKLWWDKNPCTWHRLANKRGSSCQRQNTSRDHSDSIKLATHAPACHYSEFQRVRLLQLNVPFPWWETSFSWSKALSESVGQNQVHRDTKATPYVTFSGICSTPYLRSRQRRMLLLQRLSF